MKSKETRAEPVDPGREDGDRLLDKSPSNSPYRPMSQDKRHLKKVDQVDSVRRCFDPTH